MNFFDRKPAGWHVSQLLPWPYMAPIPIQKPSVMTHTGSFLLKSTGFDIGDHIAITLMPWKHLSSRGVHWNVWLFCADPDNSVVYAIISGMYSAGIALVQETFGLHYNSRELSIPLFTASCLIWHVCHCHQWHVPDNLSCLRISQVLTLISKTATLWVIGAPSLCALYALWYFASIWIYHLDIHVQTFWEILGI